nr:ODR7 [Caenorhabditis elegans]
MIVPDTEGLLIYSYGLMYGSYCMACQMLIPHFQCIPGIFPNFRISTELIKTMTDKLEQPNNNVPQQPWGPFPPAFGGRPSGEQTDGNPGEFDNDAAHQQTAPFMTHFFPRIGLQFPDFTEYQRFNGFQRNAFFPNPFGSQFTGQAFAQSFPLHNPMTTMDGFNLPHAPHPFSTNTNSTKPKDIENTVQSTIKHSSENIQDKPPVLSVEYPVKYDSELKFDANVDFTAVPKQESSDDSTLKNLKKSDQQLQQPQQFTFPPPLLAEKSFEQPRMREDVLPFHPQFYPAPLDMGTNFKQEMRTPPIDGHIDYRKFDASGKRMEFQPPGALHDCQVCLSTHANGLHFGARTCAACAAFFRRTISDDKRYVCKRNQRCNNASRDGTGYRKICRSCRMKRCLEIGMLPENVQHKRNRRDSGSPPRKTPFDTFFNGFYPSFQPSGSAAQPITVSSSESPRHTTN